MVGLLAWGCGGYRLRQARGHKLPGAGGRRPSDAEQQGHIVTGTWALAWGPTNRDAGGTSRWARV